ncbi:MAG: hypothetical protein COT41_03780 [Candidatus Portnoybacteria bacterium CG08_land_8_20_14_0_20_40_83]|uniref:Uncharacterized protein n=2 Tax=Candidatus Portnoyibacteriota TaxID=1817913 RepID=A0A2M7YPR6_9BACT|nr:MAG: hypothetical protein COT41_03780 [Candidatus Portnoybacteria bacterium CG08_land_8_20_14_0_20_40_83]PIY75307.1 MAG: hypothetical protein COY85_00605 [Candidatus Portnoybacteria bacterium CG_4_10_14_0_8_um_filter_40_50]PJA64986.1 MAG: hypothetical protein CO159_00120 [Candidatus Portnoybacteria bacterium CG_4_9_14_3_um_filter_40_10]
MITAIKPNAMLTETDPMSTLCNLSPQDIINASTAINSVLQKVFFWVTIPARITQILKQKETNEWKN